MSSNLFKELSDDTYEALVAFVKEHGFVVGDFGATWCGPCKRIVPKFESLAAEYPNVAFLKIDVDVYPDLSAALEISGVPDFRFWTPSNDNENEVLTVSTFTGANPEVLELNVKTLAQLADEQQQKQQ